MFSKPNKQTTPSSSIHDLRAFQTFFDGWLVRQEHYLEELNSTLQNCQDSKEDDLKDLVSRVLAHYQEYYEQKSRMANHNVFLVFTPPWFTPFERSFFWIAGFKPNLAFNVLAASVEDMTEEQKQRMEQLRDDVGAAERELGNKLARIQETVASPSLVEMARRVGAPVDGEIYQVDVALETLRAAMEEVLANADMLRARTAEQVAAILSPLQNIKFLASVTQLQLQIRMWGLQKEAEAHVTYV